jgi:hypothetical protein
MGWVVSVTPRPRFTPGTNFKVDWVGPRAGLDTEARRKSSCLCWGSNLDRPVRLQTLHYTELPGLFVTNIKIKCHRNVFIEKHFLFLWRQWENKICPRISGTMQKRANVSNTWGNLTTRSIVKFRSEAGNHCFEISKIGRCSVLVWDAFKIDCRLTSVSDIGFGKESVLLDIGYPENVGDILEILWQGCTGNIWVCCELQIKNENTIHMRG